MNREKNYTVRWVELIKDTDRSVDDKFFLKITLDLKNSLINEKLGVNNIILYDKEKNAIARVTTEDGGSGFFRLTGGTTENQLNSYTFPISEQTYTRAMNSAIVRFIVCENEAAYPESFPMKDGLFASSVTQNSIEQ